MKILALEFSSSRRSVAISVDGVVRGLAEVARGLETPALGLVEQALKQAGVARGEIECIAVGLGPGSYAGIRTALAIAQGFAMTGTVGALGVSSALAIAHAARRLGLRGEFHVAVDAQRGECYLACFVATDAEVTERVPLRIVDLAEVRRLIAADSRVVGPDLDVALPGITPIWPGADDIARLAPQTGPLVSAETLKPIYLRPTTFAKTARPAGGKQQSP